MRTGRFVAIVGVSALAGVWLAPAASSLLMPDRAARERARPAATGGIDTLASDVQKQAGRLRERLNTAPSPKLPLRNPFAFDAVQSRASRAPRPTAAPRLAEPAATVGMVPPPPPLTLIGVGEAKTADGVQRTAVITAGDELFLVKDGDRVTTRFQVRAVGSDAVELIDLTGGPAVRLVLK